MTVVTPCGSTARANSGGVTRLLSICTCASMSPGVTYMPPRSTSRRPLITRAQSDHVPVMDDDVARVNLAADDVHQLPIAQDKIGGCIAASGRQAIHY